MQGKRWGDAGIPSGKESYEGDYVVRTSDSDFLGSAGETDTKTILGWETSKIAQLFDAIKADDAFTMFYASIFRGKRVVDVGSGLARQSMQFAIHGAHVTFLDINPNNLKVIERIAQSNGVRGNTRFIQIKSLEYIAEKLIGEEFDVMTVFGSLHQSPRELMSQEVKIILAHLKPGGRWLQLACASARHGMDPLL